MSDSMPPWDDLDELLDAERDVSPLDRDTVSRMSSRLAAALPLGVMGPGGGGAGGDSGDGGRGDATSGGPIDGASGSAIPTQALPALATGIAGPLAQMKVGAAIALLAVGATVGAGGHATWVAARSAAAASPAGAAGPQVDAAPASVASAVAPASSVDPAPAPSAATSASPATPRATSSQSPVASADPTVGPRVDEALRAERTLIERARTALTRTDAAAALEALRAHRARFPRGQLAEERDVLEVTALRMRGDDSAARDAAKRFQKNHPDSLLGDALPSSSSPAVPPPSKRP